MVDSIKNMISKDMFCPTGFAYVFDKNKNIVSCVNFEKTVKKAFPVFNSKTIYHFTNYGKEIISSGVFRFYWQMRKDGNTPDEVLSKYWFTEADRSSNDIFWNTHGKHWNAFSLAQITRTACFFTGGEKGKPKC